MDGESILRLALLGGAVFSVVEAVKRSLSGLSQSVLWVRLLPLLPLLLGGLGAVLVPSLSPPGGAGERTVFGVLAGSFSGSLYQVVARQFSAVAKVKEVQGE